MSKTKRVLSMFLAIFAFLLFCCSGMLVQTARAIVGIDDAIIAIIIAALSAMGITFVVTASYSSLEEYVGDLIMEYAQSRGMAAQDLFVGCQSGSNRLGQLLLNNRFVVVISTFASWLKLKFGLYDNMTVNVQSGEDTWGGMTVYRMPITLVHVSNTYEQTYEVYRFEGSPVYALFAGVGNDNSYAYLRFVSKGEAQIQRKVVYANGNEQTDAARTLTYYPNAGCYLYFQGVLFASEWPAIANVVKNDEERLDQLLSGEIESGGASIDIVTGVIDIPTDDSDFDDEGAILDLDAPWGLGYDDLTDVVIPGIFAEGEVPATRLEIEEESVVQEQVADTPAQSISSDAEEYQVIGLQNVFPFCIPFDIYAFFECLAADPVAPVVNWRFYVPGICDETITLDLSQFNTVAQIVRTMELLAFIVGLALVTREKFLRG